MKTFIGIDIGTSGAKLLLVDETGKVLAAHTERYSVSYPRDGWSEQDPDLWFDAVDRGMTVILDGKDRASVAGISFGGQMHGLVILDKNDKVIRPCILWNDGRTEKQTAYLNEVVGRTKLSDCTANIAFAGFTAPKLLWLKENEPKNFAAIAKIMLPKDYVAYRMTGVHATDYSDAAGTLLLDVEHRDWSNYMLKVCGITRDVLPELYESFEKIGTLDKKLQARWGLGDVAIIAGAGDNAAAAVGTGTVNNGDCNISLGTSGTVFIAEDKFAADGNNALHLFCHANGKHHLMGCILSAASCNMWWMNVLGAKDFAKEQVGAEEYVGKNDVYFLPYLMGERSPHNDVNAKGAFIGLRPTTTREQLTLAVMEGVAFALRDCMEAAKAGGVDIKSTRICGGGARSKLWQRVIANVSGVPVEALTVEEGPAYGGAMLAMVGCGVFDSVKDAARSLVKVKSTVEPSKAETAAYEQKYQVYRALYPALKNVFPMM